MTYQETDDTRVPLDNSTACIRELERCSYGLSKLTQEATTNTEALAEVEGQYDLITAALSRTIRTETDAKMTATEINSRIEEAISESEKFGPVRHRLIDLKAAEATLARRIKTLEKRAMNAQSALKAHESEARNAGYGGPGNHGHGTSD